MSNIIILKSEQETIKKAQKLAQKLKKTDFLCLNGTLGAGKSVFSREIIRFLTKNPVLDVPSPTFTLVQMYETTDFPIFHFDLYRLEKPDDVLELGWEDAIHDGLCLVEWPEKAGHFIPKTRTDIHIKHVQDNPNARALSITEITP